jgi:hypothetical protein
LPVYDTSIIEGLIAERLRILMNSALYPAVVSKSLSPVIGLFLPIAKTVRALALILSATGLTLERPVAS